MLRKHCVVIILVAIRPAMLLADMVIYLLCCSALSTNVAEMLPTYASDVITPVSLLMTKNCYTFVSA